MQPIGESGTRERLQAAAVRVAAGGGLAAASVRSIAREAGVTEGALYRHFKTKEELFAAVYDRLVSGMVESKKALVASAGPVRPRLREWVRLTYRSFDADPEGFTYVLLTDADRAASVPPGGVSPTAQSVLFTALVRQGQASGELLALAPVLATALFTGLLLNIPRLIRAGILAGSASRYVDEVADATWRLLGAPVKARKPAGASAPGRWMNTEDAADGPTADGVCVSKSVARRYEDERSVHVGHPGRTERGLRSGRRSGETESHG